jgi:hypothetical protein
MKTNEVTQDPNVLLDWYKSEARTKGYNYIFQGIECVVSSCTWATGKHTIITKVLRKGDIDNGIICTEQKS